MSWCPDFGFRGTYCVPPFGRRTVGPLLQPAQQLEQPGHHRPAPEHVDEEPHPRHVDQVLLRGTRPLRGQRIAATGHCGSTRGEPEKQNAVACPRLGQPLGGGGAGASLVGRERGLGRPIFGTKEMMQPYPLCLRALSLVAGEPALSAVGCRLTMIPSRQDPTGSTFKSRPVKRSTRSKASAVGTNSRSVRLGEIKD